VAAVAIAVLIVYIYLNSHTAYDFTHLTQTAQSVEGAAFVSLGNASVPGMEIAAASDSHYLYIDPATTAFAVRDTRNNFIWHSRPPGTDNDALANPFERGVMTSNLGFRYYDPIRRRIWRWVYPDSAENEQAEIYSIPNGFRVVYHVGDISLGINVIPPFMEAERFEERVLSHIEDEDDLRFLRRWWIASRIEGREGFMQLLAGISDSVINVNRMLELFEYIGYTLEELEYDNNAADIELDISLEFFTVSMDFVLEGSTLTVNIPLDEIETEGDTLIERLELLRFFGAGSAEEEGFLLVPSGSGGIIRFNNGKYREDSFMSSVYGLDGIMNDIRPQVMQPVRLPIFGIYREGAAMLAHVYRGSAMAGVNAMVAGNTNSYNYAWFNFTLRNSIAMDMAIMEGANSEMTIVQPYTYTGDITVKYHFLAGEDAGLGGMARVYQDFLVEQGVLTPLTGQEDRSFYLDIVAAVDMRQHFLGTPYLTTEVMTSLADAGRIVSLLEAEGINRIQMQLHGWFNRGINHDVAKRINPIRAVGTAAEKNALNRRLEQNGGALFPAVNFQLTNFFSRNMNRTFEAARDPSGRTGFMSGIDREWRSTRFSYHRNDFHTLVSPGVLPFHIDSFIPSFINHTDIRALSLTDMGDMLVESMYRRGAVDREHSRLIVMEQLDRLHAEFPNIAVYGGNDYAIGVASHLIGVPTEADMFYILDQSVPFYQMVVHGFIEYAGASVNLRENVSVLDSLLNSLATGASPRYTLTAEPTRIVAFSPHERMYSTHYVNWIRDAAEHYAIFNEIYRDLRTERIVDFEVLADGRLDLTGAGQITVTVFEGGTRIYVNNTRNPFVYGDLVIEPNWFYVSG